MELRKPPINLERQARVWDTAPTAVKAQERKSQGRLGKDEARTLQQGPLDAPACAGHLAFKGQGLEGLAIPRSPHGLTADFCDRDTKV